MLLACNIVAAAALLLFYPIDATTITTGPKATSTMVSVPETCESRTINYITDSLPRQCLRSSWSNSNATFPILPGELGNTTVTGEGQIDSTITHSSDESSQDTAQSTTASESSQESSISGDTISSTLDSPTAIGTFEETATDIESGELNEASFLSFEDWKKQTLEKAGQANINIGNKRSGGGEKKKRDSESIQNNLESLGDDGEIDLDFAAFRSRGESEHASQASETKEPEPRVSQDLDGRRKDQYRSKDAGKTCKERFSYASFDAGATILKTHSGAKNAKAVLIENKDSYMLSECAAENKFLIVELSEDIWIDTVVLANYEFFSSMIRTFRISVSDRYPVKMEKWKVLGLYEARNSREIQAFLVENPQIWARYLRIEFLSHYGNEYYCPLSLLRVHGTRMLESWKETEASGDDDDADEVDGHGGEEQFVPDAVAEVVQEEERLNAELRGAQAAINGLVQTASSISNQVDPTPTTCYLPDFKRSLEDATAQQVITPWVRHELAMFILDNTSQELEICLPTDAPEEHPIPVTPGVDLINNSTAESNYAAASSPPTAGNGVSPLATLAPTSPSHVSISETSSLELPLITGVIPNVTSVTSSINDSVSSVVASVANRTSNASSTSKTQDITASQKGKTSSISSASSALPTIQESFFKAVSRRLQLLETNSTLSLKYIEEQSKILREAFTKVEKKQLQKTTIFLDSLNSTVLAELRGFRQQYDEIWQSTIISLESQREESRREILAISTRLNILADEVVFQKRMSIVQSVLLLLCLGLVIFSRVSTAGHLDFPSMQARARNLGFPVSPLESPESPEFRRAGPMRDGRQWLLARSDGSPPSRSRSRDGRDDDGSPPTPTSTYSRSEDALTPPSGAENFTARSSANIVAEQLEFPEQTHYKEPPEPYSDTDILKQHFSSSSPPIPSPTVRTPKKRKAFTRQQSGPPPDDPADKNSSREAYDDNGTIRQEKIRIARDLSQLPSPPLGKDRPSFSIVRKPLPALPTDGN